MTSVLKQDPNTKKVQKNVIYYKTKPANFGGNPLCQATKRHLNNSETGKNDENVLKS